MAHIKVTVDAGLLTRDWFKSQVRSECRKNGLNLRIQEDRRWFSSTIFVHITGKNAEIVRMEKFLKELEQC